jgi:acetyl esterase/lipase
MRTAMLLGLLFGLTSVVIAAPPREEFPLWPNGAPGALGKEAKDIPTLTPYFANPEKSLGAAMVVFPGGGYGGLAPYEGRDYAMWLNEQGVSAFVLKYRLGPGGYKHPIMLGDAARAVRYVRDNATEWMIDPQKVGIMGSSAGGHLASTLLTHYDVGDANAADPIDKQSSRPSLGILCYPVITMGEKTHSGSKKNLLGDNPDPELVKNLSNELQVTKDTPPTFLFHTVEDTGVVVDNSLLFAAALAKNGVPFALHIYPKGRHGIGLGTNNWDPAGRHPWTRECQLWLQEMKFSK